MTKDYRMTRAVVLTTEGASLGSGVTLGARSDQAALLLDLPRMLDGAARLIAAGGAPRRGATYREGVLMVSTSLAELEMRYPTPKPAPGTSGPRLQRVGRWTYTTLRPWTTFRADDEDMTIHVGLLPDVPAKRSPLFSPNDEPGHIARVLDRWHALTGAPWHGTGGVTGCTALRRQHSEPGRGRQPLWTHQAPRGARGAGVLIWSRPLPDDAAGYVHLFDINAQYLAAMRNAVLGWGPLVHTGATAFDPKITGYWRIDARELPAWVTDEKTRPPVISPRLIDPDGTVCTTTAVMRLLLDDGISPDVVDSWTCDNPHPIMRAYAERLMSVRAGDQGETTKPIREGIKRVYAETVGMIAREGGRIYRRDWSDEVIDLARCNLLRRLTKAAPLLGWPVRVNRDEAAYLSEESDWRKLAPVVGVGTAPGLFKHVGTLTVDEYREQMYAGASK